MSATRIRKLSRDLINKIAAGEVVERPASVIKELVENSLDAGATRVEVTLEEGGRKLIRVVDDGRGMSPEDLALAFEPHATSKIAEVEDLFNIGTLGFRGEALASIGSVSHCRAVSREREQAAGAVIECDAGRIGEVKATGAPEGTLIEARDLFFNVPARLKFLRTTATELRHAVEMLTRLALPQPEVSFALTHNGRTALKLERSTDARERLGTLFGEELARGLLPVRSETTALTVTGFVSPPGAGEMNSIQYVFLNGRYIRDRAIQRAIIEAYRSRIMRGKHPVAFLDLRLDPARVDVNVHPTKVEVRFRDPGAVFAQVLSAIEGTLRSAGPAAMSAPAQSTAPAESTPADRAENVRQAVVEFFDRSAGKAEPAAQLTAPRPTPVSTGTIPVPPPSLPSTRAPEIAPDVPHAEQFVGVGAGEPQRVPVVHHSTATPHTAVQVHNSYLIEETADGFLLIDQHALHERILYEELRQRLSSAAVPRQKLLIPEVVDLRAPEFLRVMEMREDLLRMGLEVEAFGERTVAVQAVPHMATKVPPRELLMEVLKEGGEESAGEPADRQDKLMRVIACKAAVKAGERLSPAQISALLERRDRFGPEPTCPHGRPTTLRFTMKELAKQFRRT